jgi:hypothetical protein
LKNIYLKKQKNFGIFIKNNLINEYILKGVYITEDYINRIPNFENQIKTFNRKQEFRDKAESQFQYELNKFNNRI